MFALPDEILELIVRANDDSIRTLISWSIISTHIRDLVGAEIGIITITDGQHPHRDFPDLLGFQILIDPISQNHLQLNSDDIDDEYIQDQTQSFKYFISRFNNILIVIDSARPFSEHLTNTLTRIANSCHLGINICVFYKTSTNFLSKLYFKPFKLLGETIVLTELYIFGNDSQNESVDSLVDIETLFQNVIIQDLKSIYSLDIFDDSKNFLAPDLITIKKINYNDHINIGFFLRNCIKIKNIDSLKFPLLNQQQDKVQVFQLPTCNRITLNEFNNDVKYPIINGNQIKDKLTLNPSLRSNNPIFKNLLFPNIKTLEFEIYTFKIVNLINCYFNNVINLDMGNCIIPWNNFKFNNVSSEFKLNISLRLTDWQQLHWLYQCPYQIDTLEIKTNLIKYLQRPKRKSIDLSIPMESRVPHQEFNVHLLNNKEKINSIVLNIDSIEQCQLLSELVEFDSLHHHPVSSLTLYIQESKLFESIILNQNIRLNQHINLPTDSLEHLTIILKEDKPLTDIQSIRQNQNSPLVSSSEDITTTTIPKPSTIETVSPSQFRKNSLAGLSSHEARKQSIISFDSIHPTTNMNIQERRRSSIESNSIFSNNIIYNNDINEFAIDDDSLDNKDFITLNLTGSNCPKIITTNLNCLESSILLFNDLPNNVELPLLQICFNLDSKIINYNDLIINLTNKLIDLIHYPFQQMIHMISFHKLQLLINLRHILIELDSSITFESLVPDLNISLINKGHSLNFIKYNPVEEELIYVSPKFSVCIDI